LPLKFKNLTSKQVALDLAMFRLVMWAYENLIFDVKAYFIVGG